MLPSLVDRVVAGAAHDGVVPAVVAGAVGDGRRAVGTMARAADGGRGAGRGEEMTYNNNRRHEDNGPSNVDFSVLLFFRFSVILAENETIWGFELIPEPASMTSFVPDPHTVLLTSLLLARRAYAHGSRGTKGEGRRRFTSDQEGQKGEETRGSNSLHF